MRRCRWPYYGRFAAGRLTSPGPVAHSGRQPRVRAQDVHVQRGKLPALQARFRDHTKDVHEAGMTSIGYWTPQDAALAEHADLRDRAPEPRAAKSWAAFRLTGMAGRGRVPVDGRILSKARIRSSWIRRTLADQVIPENPTRYGDVT